MTKICVLGLGYVGLPIATVISENGGEVIGVDINKSKVYDLQNGKSFLEEEQLINLWKKENKKMRFSTKVESSDIYIIAVPTPLIDSTETCDYSFVNSAIESVIPFLEKGNCIALTSTCPVGTTSRIVNNITLKRNLICGIDFYIAYCPERLYPGNTYNEIKNNWHIVGGATESCTEKIYCFYNKYITDKIIQTTAKVAEFSKLVENSYRDVNIAFANEISALAEKESVDVDKIISVANKHPRVNILQPGIGVGGHCLPIDPWFLNPTSLNSPNSIIRAARQINDFRPHYLAEKILEKVVDLLINQLKEIKQASEKKIHVLLLGYTYKEDSQDSRESPALAIEISLKQRGLKVSKYDPLIDSISEDELIKMNKESMLTILLVNHSCFKEKLAKLEYISWKDV